MMAKLLKQKRKTRLEALMMAGSKRGRVTEKKVLALEAPRV